MARDIAGFLTGIESTQQPVQPVPGTPGFRGQFGAARAQGLGAGIGGLMRGGEPSTQERIQGAISQLDLNNPDDLATLAKVQQARGDLAGAAQTVNKIRLIKETEEAKKLKADIREEDLAISESRFKSQQDLQRERIELEKQKFKDSSDRQTAQDRKAIREATKEARSRAGTARQMLSIAEGYEKYAPAAGAVGRTLEGLNSFLGTQGDVETLRVQFRQVRNQAVLNSLPPGAASDKDVALALGGFPTEFYSPSQIASYLRGQAKLAALVSEGEQERAEWLSKNKGDDAGFADYWEEKQKTDKFTEELQDKYNFVWEEAQVVDGSSFKPTTRPSSVREIRGR